MITSQVGYSVMKKTEKSRRSPAPRKKRIEPQQVTILITKIVFKDFIFLGFVEAVPCFAQTN